MNNDLLEAEKQRQFAKGLLVASIVFFLAVAFNAVWNHFNPVEINCVYDVVSAKMACNQG